MTGPLVQAVGWALLHLLWQGALVSAILAAALALLRRQSANARYLASCGALVLLVAFGVVTAYRLYEPAMGADLGPPAQVTRLATLTNAAPVTDTAISLIAFLNIHLAQIVGIWLAGVLILSTRLFAGWLGARKLASRGAQPAGEQWQRSLYRIASSLRLWRPVRLLESAAVEVPTVVGWLRPVVLLPVASLSGLSTQQIEMVLAHELAHIRRHDFIVNLMQSVVETLLFYHPAVWWISNHIRVEREHCCDDLAVAVFGDPLQYARALTRFEELRLNAAQTLLAASGGSLLARIRRLVLTRAESASWSSRWAAGATLLAVVTAMLIAPALPAFANHDDPKPLPPPKVQKSHSKSKSTSTSTCDTESNATVDVEASADPDVDVDVDVDADPDADPDAMPQSAATPVVAFPDSAALAQAVADGVRGGVDAAQLGPAIAEAFRDGIQIDTRRAKNHRHIGEGGKLTVDDLVTLRSAGITDKYIDEMRNAGIPDLTLDDLVDLKMVGVTPGYVRELADAGYTHLTARDLVRLKASGVNAGFIRELSKYRSK